MRQLYLLFILIISAGIMPASAQTVGLFSNNSGSYNGYTLFSPAIGDSVYLIDNCGRLVHKWHGSSTSVRQPAILDDDGNLWRAGTSNNPFFAPGGGIIEKLDWNSDVLWSYTMSDSTEQTHHDFKVMPNGHILVVAWERKLPDEQVAAGRDPAHTPASLWPDKVMELKPIGPDSAVIVWQWKVWDHLVQEFNPSKNNYGSVADHPELIDVNLLPTADGSWNHINSIDYNPQLDQILLSSRNLNEIWIIDHTTTTEQAASHAGGACGHGGDLLYRWGNPSNYQHGTINDQRLFGQHDAQWIRPGYPNAGMISLFNNGAGRPGGSYSNVYLLRPPLTPDHKYALTLPQPYGPSSPHWLYPTVPDTSFFSNTMGGASMQPNGNFLITEANSGNLFEVDSTGALVWQYISPVKAAGIITQGDPAAGNQIFKVNRYGPGYAGFTTHTLTPGDPIEINPLAYSCSTGPTSVSIKAEREEGTLSVYPNPAEAEAMLRFDAHVSGLCMVRMMDMEGRTLWSKQVYSSAGANLVPLHLDGYAGGSYVVEVVFGQARNYARLVVR